jgi:hypothetical protein
VTTAPLTAPARASASSRRTLVATSFGDRLAYTALVLAAIAAAAGLLVAGLYRDPAEMVRQARAADLVTIALVVPALGLGLWRARSGSPGGRCIALGALGYLAYSYAIFAFSVVINPMTPVHLAILGLASWGLVLAVAGPDEAILGGSSRIRLPRRTAGWFLIVVAALFGLLWLGQIGSAITSGALPASIADLGLPTNAVYALDLAFALPVLAVAGAWLLLSDRRGPATATAALAFIVLMGSSVLAIFAIDAAAGVALEVAPCVIFALVTGGALVLLARGLRPTAAPSPIASTTQAGAA